MDAVSYALSAKQKERIERVIANPDSNSGIVTVPKVIGAGETVTVPAGRVAVLPNVEVEGTLNVDGEVFIPSGATFSKVVETEGNQGIDGIKTFTSSPIVPTPTTDEQVANKGYVDSVAVAVPDASTTVKGIVKLATNEETAAGTDTTRAVTPAGLMSAFNKTGSAPMFACRAWVNFNGTGTVTIRASGNVSSITDNGVGNYTVNFTTAMPDANYSVTGSAREDAVNNTANFSTGIASTPSQTKSAARIFLTNNVTAGAPDSSQVHCAIFR